MRRIGTAGKFFKLLLDNPKKLFILLGFL